MSACAKSKSIEPKQKVFEFPVNHQIPKEAATFFDKGEGDIRFQSSNVDIKKLGTYEATILYKNKGFPIEIQIKDDEKPEVKLVQNPLVVALDTKLEHVQDWMRKNIMITDNYDTAFEELKLLSSMPTTEKEMVFSIKIKDSSGNESNPVEMVVQFTKKGDKKNELGKEKTPVSATVKPQAPNTRKPQLPKRVDNATPPIRQTQNTPPPVKSPRPQQQPSQPKTLPMLTVENFPAFALGNSGRVFATYKEAYEWANTQVTTAGSPWYEYQMDISNPFLPGYANTGSDHSPYTVSFWNYDAFG